MPFSGGNVAEFSFGGTNISAFTSSVSMDSKRDIKDLNVIGGNTVSHTVGPASTTISLEGFFDPTLDALLAAAMFAATPAVHTFSYVVQGTGDTFTGSGYLASYKIDTPGDDSAKWTAEIAVSTAVAGP